MTGRCGRVAILLLLAALLLAGGCRRVARPGASDRTAEESWDQAEKALADGHAATALALYRESLALDGAPARYRSAAVALAGAGHLDLAEMLLAGQQTPSLTALAEAVALYRQSPPPGHANDPYVVAAMADALLVLAASTPTGALDQPVLLSAQDLTRAAHAWQAWVRCRAAEAGGELDGRAMALWRLETTGATVPGQAWVVHAAGTSAPATHLVHQGSTALQERLAMELPGPEAEGPIAGPAALHLAAWAGETVPTVLVLDGRWEPAGLVVTAASDVSAFKKVTDYLADPALLAGQFVAVTQPEADAIAVLAERLGYAARLVRQEAAISVAPPDDQGVDDGEGEQWLVELAGYVRYGR